MRNDEWKSQAHTSSSLADVDLLCVLCEGLLGAEEDAEREAEAEAVRAACRDWCTSSASSARLRSFALGGTGECRGVDKSSSSRFSDSFHKRVEYDGYSAKILLWISSCLGFFLLGFLLWIIVSTMVFALNYSFCKDFCFELVLVRVSDWCGDVGAYLLVNPYFGNERWILRAWI